MTTGDEIRRFEGHRNTIRSVAFSPDGKRLASGSVDNTIRLWDVATGDEIRRFEGQMGWGVYSVAFSSDGTRLASGSADGTIRLWDAATPRWDAATPRWAAGTGDEIRRFGRDSHTDVVYSVAFSPDGTRLASGSDDRTIRLWDVATGDEMFRFKGNTFGPRCIAFSPDGSRLAYGTSVGPIKLYDVATGDKIGEFHHRYRVHSVAFSPDGTRLASGSGDHTIRLWDVATGDEIRRFEGHTSSVYSVAFAPDGTRLASGSKDRTIRLWDVASPVSIVEAGGLPATITLEQNYPNPFNPTTTIYFELPEPAHVRLHVFNVLGRHVTTLVNQLQTVGRHEAHFHAAGLASGTYF
jgi:WD40 repeat protein